MSADPQRRPAGDVGKTGACVHQGADAQEEHLRRGDERPLLPRLRLLRQQDDPAVAGGGAAVP